MTPVLISAAGLFLILGGAGLGLIYGPQLFQPDDD